MHSNKISAQLITYICQLSRIVPNNKKLSIDCNPAALKKVRPSYRCAAKVTQMKTCNNEVTQVSLRFPRYVV